MPTKTKGRVIQCPAAFETTVPDGSLFALTGNYLTALHKLAEIDLDPQTIADTLESLEGDIAVKSLRVIAIAQQYDAFAGAIQERMIPMAKRMVAAKAQAERLRTYVTESLRVAGFEGGDKIVSPEIELRLQNNPPKVEIEDEALVPAFYWRQPEQPPLPPKVIDKAMLAEALKREPAEGEAPPHVPGAKLTVSVRLVEK